MQDYLAFCQQLIQEAGQMLRDQLAVTHRVTRKSSTFDLVTEVDEAVQQLLVQRIRSQFPEHGIVAEEALAESEASDLTWYIDPLDGTTNYWHRVPFFCTSMALCDHDGPLLGVIYAPANDELFWATRGGGAFNRHGPLQVSHIDRLEQSLIVTGFPYQRAPGTDNNLTEFTRVVPHVQGIRRSGSAALDLAYVAAGRFDGYWEFYLKPWDALAGQLMVSEAGGHLSIVRSEGAIHGAGGMLATNGRIHGALRDLLTGE
ncbi:MAG: inositol monophosphatase [Chloroflexaceae bacterium]|nr:inositol monophosphatase [Chloroflexaceae bacterium]